MRLYNVLLNDGTSETVEAPDDATKEQLAAAINRKRVGPSIYEAYSKGLGKSKRVFFLMV
jgi:hypothetical protein